MPETPEKNAYEILGIARTASQDEIKKRYREMARQYHPDVNQGNPGAAKMFAQITGAYKTLSDASSRANYDADLTLKEKRAQQAAAQASGVQSQSVRSSTAPSAPTQNSTAVQQQKNIAESARLVADAQAAFARGRFVEARTLSEQALRLNRRSERAYEVLGDIFRLQGKTDEAINMYSMSLQINPRNPPLMQRLERLTRMTGTTFQSLGQPTAPTAQKVFFDNTPRPSATRPSDTPPPMPPRSPVSSSYAAPSAMANEKRSLGLLIVGFVGYVGVMMLLVYAALYHGEAPQGAAWLPIISSWNGTIWSVLALSGFILGATMTITGAVQRLEDELVLGGSAPRTGIFLPMGLLIIVIAVINFYVAAIVYTVTSLLQESFTKSMGRVFGMVIGVVGLLALIYTPGPLQILLWGGNVVFLCLIIGWLLGDIFRPEHI